VTDIQPHVTKVGRSFAHLREDIPSLVDVTLVCENTADTVRRPDVARVVAQDGLVHTQRTLLVTLLLLIMKIILA